MTKYPISEPFNDIEYKNTQNSYKNYLIKRYEKDNTFDDDTPVSLKDIYTPLRLGKDEHSEDEETFDVEDALCRHQFIALSGLAGSGKSTVTKFLSIVTAENGVNETVKKIGKRVVLPIILRELDFDKIYSLNGLFEQWIAKINYNAEKTIFDRDFFDFYITKGWAILIFDGFDEIGEDKNANLIKWLDEYILQNQINQQKEIKTNIIITGRPTGFLNNVDYKRFTKLHLQPFNQEQIEIYTKNYFSIKYAHQKNKIEEKSKIFLERLDKFEDLKQLKSRPIYLMMLAYISENKGELPKTRTLAYQQMIESYLHILDKQKELYEKAHNIELPQWDIYDKTILLEELAYKIHTKADKELEKTDSWKRKISQLQIQVSKEETLDYLKEIVADARFRSIGKDECVTNILNYYLARTGLIIEPQDGFIQFSHLSFQEYLTASRIYRRQPKRKVEAYLKEELFDKIGRTGWSEIALLFYGIDTLKQGEEQSQQLQFLIDEKNPAHFDFIINLITLTENQFTDDEIDRWFKTILYTVLHSNNPHNFFNVIKSFGKRVQEESSEHHLPQCYEKLVAYIFKLADKILDNKSLYTEDDLLEVLDEDNEDFAYRIKSQKNQNSLENILYIGFYFKEFKNSFITIKRLSKIPIDNKNHELAFVLDKYIPYNKNLKIEIANRVIEETSPLMWVELNGDYPLRYSTLFANDKFFKEILKIQILVNKYAFYIDIKRLNETNLIRTKLNKNNESILDMETIETIDRNMSKIGYTIKNMDRILFNNIIKVLTKAKNMASDMDNNIYRIINYTMNIFKKNKMNKYMLNLNKPDYNNIDRLVLKCWLFSLYASAKLFAKEINMNIDISKEAYQELYTQLASDPIVYFEAKGHILDERRKEEIEELFDKSYLLPTMQVTLENTEYEVFDEEKALEDYHQMIKDFIKENEKVRG